MLKNCENCGNVFKAKGSAPKCCSQKCANVQRKIKQQHLNRSTLPAKHLRTVALPPPPQLAAAKPNLEVTAQTYVLPPPEELPAPYAKRVYEMWLGLINGERNAPTRLV